MDNNLKIIPILLASNIKSKIPGEYKTVILNDDTVAETSVSEIVDLMQENVQEIGALLNISISKMLIPVNFGHKLVMFNSEDEKNIKKC